MNSKHTKSSTLILFATALCLALLSACGMPTEPLSTSSTQNQDAVSAIKQAESVMQVHLCVWSCNTSSLEQRAYVCALSVKDAEAFCNRFEVDNSCKFIGAKAVDDYNCGYDTPHPVAPSTSKSTGATTVSAPNDKTKG